MRAGFWIALDARLHEFFGQATQERLGESDRILKAISVLNDHVDAIEPARVDLTQELADDIVRKIHGPLTISQEFSDDLRKLAGRADWFQVVAFGHGGVGSGRLELRIKTDGAMCLEIRDFSGQPMWRGTFVPPGYGES